MLRPHETLWLKKGFGKTDQKQRFVEKKTLACLWLNVSRLNYREVLVWGFNLCTFRDFHACVYGCLMNNNIVLQ